MKNTHNTLSIIHRLNNGEAMEDIADEIEKVGKQRAKEKGKCWGECHACGETTVLESHVHLCGPCCFGESETYNGNW